MRKFYSFLLALVVMTMLVPSTAQAGNRYLWTFENFQALSMGNGVVRFTLPVWVYGKGSNSTEYLSREWAIGDWTKESYVFYREDPNAGIDGMHRIMTFGADRGNNYDCRETGYGYSYAFVHEGAGIVQNMYNGVPVTILLDTDELYRPSTGGKDC